MATSIGSVSDLVSLIQAQLTARAQKAAPAARATVRKGAATQRYAQENLTRLIEVRVNQIGRDDPQRGRKAFRVFLETVLLSHFGESLVNDARFFQMVEDVQAAMEADPACATLIGRAIDHLLSNDG